MTCSRAAPHLASALFLPLGAASRARAAGKPTLVNSIRSLSNPYHATWNKGGAAFAKSVGADYVTLVTEGNSEKGVADIKAILAKTGGNCVINVDPNDSPDARPIVEACKQAGAYVVTQWNKPADLHPWDNNPNYVAHISFSGVPYGKAMAEALIKAMGGKGGIVALGGIESNMPAIERKKGLDAALAANPGVKLLDFQVANWSANEALEKVNAWLTKFGDKIRGIWAANDDMALAAVEALRADGRAGKVPVTGIDGIKLAVEAIQKGEMAGTVAWDPYLAGRHGPGDRLRSQDRQVRSGQGAEGASRVLRQGRDRHRRQRQRILRRRTSRASRSSTGTTSGAASAARSPTTSRRERAVQSGAGPRDRRWSHVSTRHRSGAALRSCVSVSNRLRAEAT